MGDGLEPLMDSIRLWAILPVKPFKQAKSRLAGVLSPAEREALAITLFQRSAGILAGITRFSGVLVVSRDPDALKMARGYGAHTLLETDQPELNPALRRASETVMALGATGVFIMPADLPFVTAADVEQMIHLGRFRRSVVLAPDSKYDGTNSLFMTPPNLMPLAYGIGSFARHRTLAEAAEATIHIYESSRMALDIDTPDDLEVYRASQKDAEKMITGTA